MLEVALAQFRYGKKGPALLEGVEFDLAAGEILTILGQNGSGKTTLLHCLLGVESGYQGRITFAGRDLRQMGIVERSRAFAYVAANIVVHQDLRVADYLVAGFTNSFSLLGMPGRDHYQAAWARLRTFGKASLFDRLLSQLSAGERQIVMICRAILQRPAVLILDEPTANLDLGYQEKTLGQLQDLAAAGYSVITTTHNLQHALKLGGKVLLLADGVVRYGPAGSVITKETIEAAYDVKVTVHDLADGPLLAFSAT